MKHSFTLLIILFFTKMLAAQNVGIGTTTPSANLHVNGSFKLTDGTQGPAKVLTSDALGAASWQANTAAASPTGGVGFGAWGDCSTRNISSYNPVAANDGAEGDYFGYSVSINGNYAIVGAYYKTVGSNVKQGAAYIYHFDGTVWVQQAMLTASDGAANDYFGWSVSISGNYAIVGANIKTVGANTFQGQAYIFNYNGSAWVQQDILTASDGAASDGFGQSVSINGNFAIVGAFSKTVGSNAGQGKAYIYYYNGSSWVQQAMPTASDGASNDFFGGSVSINGNYAFIGAFYKTIGANAKQGKVYIYKFNGLAALVPWSRQAMLLASDGAANDQFGTSVSVNGNYAIVGANYKEVVANANQGVAYIYHFDGTVWVQQGKLTANDGATNDYFGSSVSINGNYAVVGANNKTVGSNANQGAAYLYQNMNGIWHPLQKVTDPGGAGGDYFGNSVTIDGGRFLIGAWGVQNGKGMAFFGKVEP